MHDVVQKYNAGQNKSFRGGSGGDPFSKGSPRREFEGRALICTAGATKKPTDKTKHEINSKANRPS